MQYVGVLFLSVGVAFSLLNWLCVLMSLLTGRYHSVVPLVGAAFLAVGMVLFPDLRPYVWAALLVDVGTALVLPALPKLAWEIWTTSRFCLLEQYVGRRGALIARLRLFRRNIFTVRRDLARPPGECGVIATDNMGTWEQNGDILTLRYDAHQVVFMSVGGDGVTGWCITDESGHLGTYTEMPLNEVVMWRTTPSC